MATSQVSQWNNTESLITIGINFLEEDGLNKAMLYELSNADVAIVTIAAKLEHGEELKAWIECPMDMD